MANVLSQLLPFAYEAMDIVSREQIGFLPAVTLNATADRIAQNQTLYVPVTQANVISPIAPGQLPPDDGDQTINNVPIVMSQFNRAPFRWTGEEEYAIDKGVGVRNIQVDQIAQGIRALTNSMEQLVAAQYVYASRAWGTPGTSPFQTDLSDIAQVGKILKDNGSPPGDMHQIINTTAGVKLRSLTQLTKANEAGTTMMREQGNLLDIFGFETRESAQINTHIAGTGTGYVVNAGGGLAIGTTIIPVQTGVNTILQGDFITFAGDTNKYMVTTGLTAGNVVIAAPGLRQTQANAVAITVGASYTANMAFTRNSIVLATRAPALPTIGGVQRDLAVDRFPLIDPRSGITFELAVYEQYMRVHYELQAVYGCALIKPEHSVVVLG